MTDLRRQPRIAALMHPLYLAMRDTWVKLGHVREGTGGFLDGTYLVGHPREYADHDSPNPRVPTKKLKARRTLSSYTNYADAILDSKKSALFREAPTRRVGESDKAQDEKPTPLEEWWEDVDGQGTDMDKAMPSWWDVAATYGHVALYFELPEAIEPNEGEVVTAADLGMPVIRPYTPLDIINWLTDQHGNIVSIKVVEAVQATSYDDTHLTQERIRVIDTEGWQLFEYQSKGGRTGELISEGSHGLGVLPVVWLFGKRRAVLSEIGQSILGDPKSHIDVYNLDSELRELLRNQTFSFINIPLGTGTDAMTVEQAQQMLGTQTGTMNVVFSGGPASILSGESANVTSYQEQIAAKVRAIYREAGSPWESDSKDAEAEGSMELKREELNTRLSQYADECQQAEMSLADLFYRYQFGADRGPDKLEEDLVTVQYPDRFGQTPFDDLLEQIQAAQGIGMPDVFMKELKKASVTKYDGMSSAAPAKLQAIMDAIDAEKPAPTPGEVTQQRIDLMKQAVQQGGKATMPPNPTKEAA